MHQSVARTGYFQALVLMAAVSIKISLGAVVDSSCGAGRPCGNGACCSKWGNCGYGADFCGAGCLSNCDAKANCGQHAAAANRTCPLNVCCSRHGFCGTTADFCGSGCQSNCAVPEIPTKANARIVRTVGYYALWSAVDGGPGRQCNEAPPERLAVNQFTHLIAAFAVVNREHKLAAANAADRDLLKRVVLLKQKNSALKILVAVGGWAFNDPPTQHRFSDVAASKETRGIFVKSVLSFLEEFSLDGLDIDWEYPVAAERGGRPSDKENYVSLLAELRAAFGRKYLLTIAAPLSYWYLQHFDLTNMHQHLDWINLMSYDIHGIWDADSKELGSYVNTHTNLTEIKEGVRLYMRAGVPLSKLALGTGFYARTFTLASPWCYGANCRFSGGGTAGKCTASKGTLAYFEVAEGWPDLAHSTARTRQKRNPEARHAMAIFDEESATKVIVDGSQWISYDDAETLALKRKFAQNAGISSLMAWSIDQDDEKRSLASALTASNPIFAVQAATKLISCRCMICGCPDYEPRRRRQAPGRDKGKGRAINRACPAVGIRSMLAALESLDFLGTLYRHFVGGEGGGPIREFYYDSIGRVVVLFARIYKRHIGAGSEPSKKMIAYRKSTGYSKTDDYPGDDAGHGVANALGGTGKELYNIFPQDPYTNRHVYWPQVEQPVRDFLRNHPRPDIYVDYSLLFVYEDPVQSRRPSEFFVRAAASDGGLLIETNLPNPRPTEFGESSGYRNLPGTADEEEKPEDEDHNTTHDELRRKRSPEQPDEKPYFIEKEHYRSCE